MSLFGWLFRKKESRTPREYCIYGMDSQLLGFSYQPYLKNPISITHYMNATCPWIVPFVTFIQHRKDKQLSISFKFDSRKDLETHRPTVIALFDRLNDPTVLARKEFSVK